MPRVDVVDLNNQKVGDAGTGRRGVRRAGQRGAAVRSGAALSGRHARAARTRPRRGTKWPVRARSCGSRRARAARVWVRSGRRSGGMAARCTDRNRAITATSCPRKMQLGALRSALSAKLRDGELKVVQEFALADHKTKNAMRRAGEAGSRHERFCWWTTARTAIWSWVRAISKGVKLVASREVNLYDLLGHKQRADQRSRGAEVLGGTRKMTIYEVIQRPARDRKGRHQERRRAHAVLRSARRRQQDAGQAAVEKLFKVKVAEVRTATFEGKLRRRGRFAGYRSDWKKAYVKLKAGEKDAGVRGDLRGTTMPIKSYRPTTPTRRFQTVGVARGHHQADAGKVAGRRRRSAPAAATARAA